MKPYITITTFFVIILVLLTSCEDKSFVRQMANVPIYLSYEDLRKSIQAESPVQIEKPGKIYFKDHYIFISEYMKGVHVIDIANPYAPEQVAFIPVPGNLEMAIKDNILYLDSYTDLVLMDISDPENPVEQSRINDLMEYMIPEYDYDYPLAEIDEEAGVITGFELEEYTKEVHNYYPYPIYWEYDMLLSSSVRPFGGASSYASAGSIYGIGGSMARFLTYDDYLYMIENTDKLKVVDISSPDTIDMVFDKSVGWGIETMFIYEDFLYLGATQGMYIYSLEDPKSPYQKSLYTHITSCDPVVVAGNTAYVTLRAGNDCGGVADLLEVIDVSDKSSPDLIASYGMNEPYGLGISGSTLFICQGNNGMVVYDVTDPLHMDDHKITDLPQIPSTDVIPVDTLLFTVGDNGLYIYDFSDLDNIFKIGEIEVAGN